VLESADLALDICTFRDQVSALLVSANRSIIVARLPGKRLRRAAVVIPAIKGVICALIGGSYLAYSLIVTGAGADLLPAALFLLSLPALLAAIWYLVAALLLARVWMVWRSLGALLDAVASLLISWALVEEGIVLSGLDWALPISIAIAAIWVGALLPVFAGAFGPTRPDG